MRTSLAILFAAVLAGCAGTVNLEPVADKLDDAKAAHQQSMATLHALYAAVCIGEHAVAPDKECDDAEKALAQGEAVSREALNLAIDAFNTIQEIAEEVE